MREHPVILANAILTVALSILAKTTLGDPDSISWGIITEEAFASGGLTAGSCWWLVPPGEAIMCWSWPASSVDARFDEILNPKLPGR